MRIKAIETKPYSRRFKKPLITSQGEIAERSGIIVRVTSEDDSHGFGEVAPLALFTEETIGVLKKEIDSITGDLVNQEVPASPDYITRLLKSSKINDRFTMFSIESALCDLAARSLDKPLAEWLSTGKFKAWVPVNYLISRPVDDWDSLINYIGKHGYEAVKVKIGSVRPVDDMAFINKLSEGLSSNIPIRLDANQGFDFDTAVTILKNIDLSRIEYIEEPLSGSDPAQLTRLKKETGVNVALDESISGFSEVESLSKENYCDAIIIKSGRLGSLWKSQMAVSTIIKNGCKAVVTSSLETEIGIATQLHLVASCDFDLPPCGLDTLRLFEVYDTSWFGVRDGQIKLPSGNGIGCGETIWDNL